jgi:hypothetical protein
MLQGNRLMSILIFPQGATVLLGQYLFVVEASYSRSFKHSTVRLLWTNDQPDAENSKLKTLNNLTRETSMTPAGFKPAIPASEREQTHN